jgi:hypothetical protein
MSVPSSCMTHMFKRAITRLARMFMFELEVDLRKFFGMFQ